MPASKNTQSSLKTRSVEARDIQIVKPEPLRILLEWKAPVRPFQKRSREYFTTLGAIAFLLIVILLFLQEWMAIAVIIALMFVVYIMGTVQPTEVEHRITNRGVKTGGDDYHWVQLGRFWFKEKWGQKILYIETLVSFPRRLMILLGKIQPSQAEKTLSDYLLLEEPEKTWTDKASEWLSRRVPLETK